MLQIHNFVFQCGRREPTDEEIKAIEKVHEHNKKAVKSYEDYFAARINEKP